MARGKHQSTVLDGLSCFKHESSWCWSPEGAVLPWLSANGSQVKWGILQDIQDSSEVESTQTAWQSQTWDHLVLSAYWTTPVVSCFIYFIVQLLQQAMAVASLTVLRVNESCYERPAERTFFCLSGICRIRKGVTGRIFHPSRVRASVRPLLPTQPALCYDIQSWSWCWQYFRTKMHRVAKAIAPNSILLTTRYSTILWASRGKGFELICHTI